MILGKKVDEYKDVVIKLLNSGTVPRNIKGINTIAEALLLYEYEFLEGSIIELDDGYDTYRFKNVGNDKVLIDALKGEWIYNRLEGENRYELEVVNGDLVCSNLTFMKDYKSK